MPSRMITTSRTHLDEAPRPLDRELGDVAVLVGGSVERRRDDFGAQHVPAHVGDLFRALVDEEHHDVRLGVVAFDRVHDLLDDRRLAGLRRRDDQAALALSDRRDEVDDAARDLAGIVGELESQPRVREQGREVLEAHTAARFVGRHPVDEVDAHERGVLLAACGRAGCALHVVALAQTEAPHLGRRHVRVVATGEVATDAQEAVALVAQVEQAVDVDQVAGVVVLANVVAFPRDGRALRAALPLGAAVRPTVAVAATTAAPAAVARLLSSSRH